MYESLNKEAIEDILDAPEPTLNRNDTPIIYFDQKIWGQLHAGRHDPDSRHTEAYQTVQQAVDNDDGICPYSIARFFETDAHPDETFKRELYELMIDLSNNFCMRNYFDAIGAEIMAYLFRHIDLLPEIDPADQVFDRGLIAPHGTPRIMDDGEPIDDEWKVHKIFRSEELTRQIIQSDDFAANLPDLRDEEERTDYVETLEPIRQEYEDIADTDEERREQLIIESFRNDVLPRLIHTAEQLPIDVNIFSIIARDTAFNGFDDFFMQFPTYYAHLDLILGRDFHRRRDIEANDLNDVMALAVAIPYTDAVITENFFAGVAHKQGLPNRFDTIIRTDLQDLPDLLDDI
ncbi:hypothetical protein [Halalkalicoccus subterraneus]|uniref:hypothetical protein n=1 Tax=Halalkalicoccus subterraneus TaxID=2675002 RepID=UPI000EFD9B06|nr:hypothetical protein [Halalkalicoccus subterraneus]